MESLLDPTVLLGVSMPTADPAQTTFAQYGFGAPWFSQNPPNFLMRSIGRMV